MIKKTLFIFCLLTNIICFGQNNDESELIEQALKGYYEAFYEGKLNSLKENISKEIDKYGYWRGDDGKYEGEPMTFEDMEKYVNRIKEEGNDRDISIKEIKIFDILHNTASARLKFWWGYDYILLVKEKEKWKIRMVIWEGPLQEG